MTNIPTPIPKSLATRIGAWRREGWLDASWQLLVTVGAIVVAFILAAAFPPLGVVLAFIVMYFLFRAPIHDALSDVWDRRFWRL